MTVQSIHIINDGFANGDGGEVAITANPYTLRVDFVGIQGKFLVGFFDTLAHAITALANAQTAAQFGASATEATLTTWMGTTSPQTGFVATRTNLVNQTILDEVVDASRLS